MERRDIRQDHPDYSSIRNSAITVMREKDWIYTKALAFVKDDYIRQMKEKEEGTTVPATFNELVAAERQRQIDLGYDADHDDKHGVDRLNAMARKYEQDGDFVKGQAMRRASEECNLRRKTRQP